MRHVTMYVYFYITYATPKLWVIGWGGQSRLSTLWQAQSRNSSTFAHPYTRGVCEWMGCLGQARRSLARIAAQLRADR